MYVILLKDVLEIRKKCFKFSFSWLTNNESSFRTRERQYIKGKSVFYFLNAQDKETIKLSMETLLLGSTFLLFDWLVSRCVLLSYTPNISGIRDVMFSLVWGKIVGLSVKYIHIYQKYKDQWLQTSVQRCMGICSMLCGYARWEKKRSFADLCIMLV